MMQQPCPEESADLSTLSPEDADTLLNTIFPAPSTAAPAPRLVNYAENDFGRAGRFVQEQHREARYVPELHCWIVWDGCRWIRDFAGTAILNRAIIHLNDTLQETQRACAQAAFQDTIRSGNTRSLTRMLHLAKANFRIVTPIDCLDGHHHLLNLPNGILDLTTGQLLPHDPTFYCTRIAAVEHDPKAKCPRWRQFIREIASGDAALSRYLQKLAGYILTGETTEQAFFYLHGIGANGKSTFLTTLAQLLGDYTEVIPQSLLSSISREPVFHTARTYGARFLILSELPEHLTLSDARLKVLTGSDLVTGSFHHTAPFTFIPTGKVFLQSNHLPQIHGKDEAIWRRVHLIPFQNRFTGSQRDNNLLATLIAELPGILNWAAEGAKLWKTEGLHLAPVMHEALDACRSERDPVHQFLNEQTEPAPKAKTELSDLYQHYVNWIATNTHTEPLPRIQFSKALLAHGITQSRTKSARYWTGIRLRTPEPTNSTILPFSAAA